MTLVEKRVETVLKPGARGGYKKGGVWIPTDLTGLEPVPIIKSAPESRTTTTFADDATFAAIFLRAQVWEVELRLDVTGPTGGDIKVQWTLPDLDGVAGGVQNGLVGIGFVRWCSGPALAATATSDTSVVCSTRDYDQSVSYGTDTSTTVRTAIVERLLIDTRAANELSGITLQWAQAAASGTTTIRAGSYMVGRRLV